MDTSAFINHIIGLPGYDGQIAHVEHIPPRRAVFAKLEKPLPPELEQSLDDNKLLPFYSHQAAAINCARRGENVIIATASASGKSICYNVPVMDKILSESGSCAIYLFPTKALAQDQLRSIIYTFCPQILKYEQVSTFDGDTPPADRSGIRSHCRLILTNPDMLHLGILPNHRSWSRLLRNLKYVVLDEAHSYRGVFGSHVSLVLRRLRRICRSHGSSPQFIFCSATINNPGEHACNLSGLPFSVINDDGAPRGGKDFIFWNPPLVDDKKTSRRSANSEASNLLAELVSQDTRSLAFSRTRRLTELVANYTKQKLAEISPQHAKRVKAYRAGYLAEQRRQIEQELFEGRLTGVVATNALELGIDVGDLEATILTGYPGTIASAWQQAGRSGRREGRSLSILVAFDDPLDQYFMRHPDFFFSKDFENALINPSNPYILKAHLLCAAWEAPLTANDAPFFGETMEQEIAQLEEQQTLEHKGRRYYIAPCVNYPAQDVNIRAASGDNVALIDTSTNQQIETLEKNNALFFLHTGAVYIHQGESFLVNRLDLIANIAYAEPTTAAYYTVTKEITDLHILNTYLKKKHGQVSVCLGEVEVTTCVTGFKKKAQFTEEVIGEEPLDLPPINFPTTALWFDVPENIIHDIAKAGLDLAGGLHATEHASIAMLPLFAMCDRNDIGGVSTVCHPDSGKAQVFIYDGYPGGVGIAEKGYELVEQLWQATLATIDECPCTDGCPSCIQSPKCGNNNQPLDKKAARMILRKLLS